MRTEPLQSSENINIGLACSFGPSELALTADAKAHRTSATAKLSHCRSVERVCAAVILYTMLITHAMLDKKQSEMTDIRKIDQ